MAEHEVWASVECGEDFCVALCDTEELADLVVSLWSLPGHRLYAASEPKLPRVSCEEDVRQHRPHYVYIVRLGVGGDLKVGVTTDVSNRMRDIQVHSPNEVRLLALEGPYVTGKQAFHIESRLKEVLADYQKQGEWFVWNPRLAAQVRIFRDANPHLSFLLAELTDKENAAVMEDVPCAVLVEVL